MCKHEALQRQKRSLFMKLLGVREYYVCSRCGQKLLIGSERLTRLLYPNQIDGFSKSDPTHI